MNPNSFAVLFPLGSHLCRKPMPPMSELKRDMAILNKHGFDLVKLQEHWMIDEPVAATVPVQAARVEDLLGESFQREGGQVTLTVPGLDVRVLIVS